MKICIVGGGTAGWLATLLLSNYRPNNKYVVVESSKIPIVGVGEGSTALLNDILNDPILNLNVGDFYRETEALPKMGIRFTNWLGDGTHFDESIEGSYTALNRIDTSIHALYATDNDINSHALTSTLSIRNKTNYYKDNGDLTTIPGLEYSIAYHFDAYKVGLYFKKHCIDKINRLIDSEVEDLQVENGKIKSIQLSNGETVEADLFIYCSGFSKLFSKALDQKTISFKDVLLLDKAYVFRLSEQFEKPPVTNCLARDNGWIFELPTRNKIGRAYNYCSKFADEKQIHEELQRIYGCEVTHVKTISYEAHRLENSFYGNVLSVGLASSFFEPLQATSIHCTIIQLVNFINNVMIEDKPEFNPALIEQYNTATNTLLDDVADFVSLAYECGREDTDFWKFVKYDRKRTEKVKSVKEIIKSRTLRIEDIGNYFGIPSRSLWNIMICGLNLMDKQTILNEFKTFSINVDNEINFLNSKEEIANIYIQNLNLLTQDQLNEVLVEIINTQK